MPAEFQVQNPQYANPPTLAMAVTAFIHRLEQSQSLSDQDLGLAHMANVPPSMGSASSIGAAAPEASRHLQDSTLALTYLRSIYPNLRRHYRWFKRTQKGQIQEWGRKAHSRSEAYRWRGRTEEHVLTSGLDDYPRAKPPHVGELHLDLASWVGFFTRTMFEIASYLGEEEDAEEYEMTYQAVVQNIEGAERETPAHRNFQRSSTFVQIFTGMRTNGCIATPVSTKRVGIADLAHGDRFLLTNDAQMRAITFATRSAHWTCFVYESKADGCATYRATSLCFRS